MTFIDIGMAMLAVVGGQNWTPPHYVMGYSFTEWLALLTILTIFVTAVTWLVRTVIVSPLNAQISILSSKISDMNRDREREAQTTAQMLSEQGKMIQDHERHLAIHDEDIKSLFKRGVSK